MSRMRVAARRAAARRSAQRGAARQNAAVWSSRSGYGFSRAPARRISAMPSCKHEQFLEHESSARRGKRFGRIRKVDRFERVFEAAQRVFQAKRIGQRVFDGLREQAQGFFYAFAMMREVRPLVCG
jgi:hypothetical protein